MQTRKECAVTKEFARTVFLLLMFNIQFAGVKVSNLISKSKFINTDQMSIHLFPVMHLYALHLSLLNLWCVLASSVFMLQNAHKKFLSTKQKKNKIRVTMYTSLQIRQNNSMFTTSSLSSYCHKIIIINWNFPINIFHHKQVFHTVQIKKFSNLQQYSSSA